MTKDYYEVLGVGKTATASEIKGAYRKLAMQFHPDRNKSKDAEERFKVINEAYAVLSDPNKRRQYDTFGPDQFNQRFSEEDIFRGFDFESIFRSMGFDVGGGFSGGPENIFDSLFGMGGRRRGDYGSSISDAIEVTLNEAYTGTMKKITVKHTVACGRCKGAGGEPGTKTKKCDKCNGSGQIRSTRRTPFGIMQTVSACDKCNGSGGVLEKPCSTCKGSGIVYRNDSLDITIPKGIMDGTRLIARGMGDYGRDGIGDMELHVRVRNNTDFTRNGNDLHYELHIPFYTAIEGDMVQIETMDGEKAVEIEPGTQPNSKVVLRGAGMPRFRASGSGDLIVEIIVDIPKQLTKEQRELIGRFEETDRSAAKKRGFWKK